MHPIDGFGRPAAALTLIVGLIAGVPHALRYARSYLAGRRAARIERQWIDGLWLDVDRSGR